MVIFKSNQVQSTSPSTSASHSRSIRQFFSSQTLNLTTPNRSRPTPEIITSTPNGTNFNQNQSTSPQEDLNQESETADKDDTQLNQILISPNLHHQTSNHQNLIQRTITSISTPDLRRHSLSPELEPFINQPKNKYHHHQHQHQTQNEDFLNVNSIPFHSTHQNGSQTRNQSPTPMFQLSSAQYPQDSNRSRHNSHSTNSQQPPPIGPTAALAIAAAGSTGVHVSLNNRPASITSMTSRMPPTTFKDISILYQVVAERRTAFDNLLWQVPATSLTAHAFLFSISLAADTGRFARIASMSLCIVITILTLHLFTRQLQAEDADHRWLADFEERHQIDYFDRAHGARWKDYRAQKPAGAGRLGWLAMHRSYPLWSKGMITIGALAFVILVLAIFHEPTLVGYNCQL